MSLPERLWNQAYDSLKADEAKLVKAYEDFLFDRFRNDVSSIPQTPKDRQSQMYELIQDGLGKTKKEAKMKQKTENVVKMVLEARKSIDLAVQAMPQASLAWAGFSFALQIRLIVVERLQLYQILTCPRYF